MKRFIATVMLSGMVIGLVSISFTLPPPPGRVPPSPPRWVPQPPPHRVPPPAWRIPPYPSRPWVVPPPGYWPRPPLPRYWAPPPPAIRNWWFWVWWEPLPIQVTYYAPQKYYYDYGYYPYPYYEPESPEYPLYSERYRQQPGIPEISSPEDYERWLAETLNLTPDQQATFYPKLQSLAKLREQYLTKRTSLVADLEKLQQSGSTPAELDKKVNEVQKSDTKFSKKEQQLMNELMNILTPEQKAQFLTQTKQYPTPPAVGEKEAEELE
ncbi:MAG: hypothetical protein QME64_06860 [bacterium]|nr:hypothetical protein [bacterium]